MGQTAVMMAMTGASTISQFGAQRQQAGAVLAQGQYHQRIAEWEARLAELQAEDAVKRGREAEGRYRQGIKQTIGSQRARLAAQGIAIDDGSALDVQAETAEIGELDALTIRNNATREAFGYKTEAMSARMGGESAMAAAQGEARGLRNAAWGTLLTGGAQMYGQYQGRSRAPQVSGSTSGSAAAARYQYPRRSAGKGPA